MDYKKKNLLSPVNKNSKRDEMKRLKNKDSYKGGKQRNLRYTNNVSDYEESITGKSSFHNLNSIDRSNVSQNMNTNEKSPYLTAGVSKIGLKKSREANIEDLQTPKKGGNRY